MPGPTPCPNCHCCTHHLCAAAQINRQPCTRYALVATTEAERVVAACPCAPERQDH